MMRAATTVEGSGGTNFRDVADFAVRAERLQLDVCWVAEAWGSDAPTLLGYLAARTSTMLLGSGVMQVGIRTPAAVAQAAISLSNMTDGRFLLGLGASGRQVIEGLHGVPFARPLARVRETVEIVRSLIVGDRLTYSGSEYQIPYQGTLAKPMRLSARAEHPIPLYLAALSPAMLRLTGEVGDGWLGTSFVPEGASAYFDHLDDGLTASGRHRADLDICQGAEIALFDDEEQVHRHIATRRRELAFSLGGMGSADKNYYNDAYSRQGWADTAAHVRQLWLAGEHDRATDLITDDMVLATTLIGTEQSVEQRLALWKSVGVNTVRLYPAGDNLDQRLANLGRGIALVHRA